MGKPRRDLVACFVISKDDDFNACFQQRRDDVALQKINDGHAVVGGDKNLFCHVGWTLYPLWAAVLKFGKNEKRGKIPALCIQGYLRNSSDYDLRRERLHQTACIIILLIDAPLTVDLVFHTKRFGDQIDFDMGAGHADKIQAKHFGIFIQLFGGAAIWVHRDKDHLYLFSLRFT